MHLPIATPMVFPVDCSYSTSAVEQANVASTTAGEVYVLLVTNFANSVQTISVNDAPSNTATTDCSIVPLPVELVHFSGVRNEREVKLNWTTATELNNHFFTAERSKDGLEWHSFDLVPGSGTTTSPTNYELTDAAPCDGITYYRLRQVDFDGSTDFSKIIAVDSEARLSLGVFPNPGKTSVLIQSERNYNSLIVTDLQGREVITHQNINENQTHLNVGDWKNGIYYVTVSSPFGTQTERLSILK